MKVLNLYAGIGGNRKLWQDCEVTAVEFDPKIAEVYQEIYPKDRVIVGDAHSYLEEHFLEFDFIWSSPPCQSHGQYRHNVGVIGKGYEPIIPDMRLYGEIVFLETYFTGRYVVENVVPYYTPLITPTCKLHRHIFWANFSIPHREFATAKIRSKNKISDFNGYEVIAGSKISNKRQVLRNCVDPELGLHIFEAMTQQGVRA